MAWNEPGNDKNRDPWGSRKNQDGPPDLDEVFRKLQEKLGGLFGGGKKSGGGGGNAGPGPLASLGLGMLLIIGLVVWGLSGIYILDEAERGVVLRFGKFQESTLPGPHWHLPYPIESVTKVNVDVLRTVTHKAQMLTQDENLIQIAMAVQYQVKNAENYLFRVRDPDYTLKEATESALRESVGSKKLDDILSEVGGREVLVNETERSVQEILDLYQTGLLVKKVNLESTQPPQEVQAAFEDAIKAREDQDRYKKQAEAYSRDILPKAEGDAQRLREEAEAYKQQVIAKAKGETSRFLQTLKEYKKAPGITRKRLYIETMEEVLSSVSKVMIKMKQGNSIMYLPLDRFMQQQGLSTGAPRIEDLSERNIPSSNSRSAVGREILRGREVR